MIAAAAYGWRRGDPRILLIGWDSDSNGCGYSNTTKDYPYLYWPQSPSTDMVAQINAGNFSDVISILSNGVCVS
jgi:hypothetical protein